MLHPWDYLQGGCYTFSIQIDVLFVLKYKYIILISQIVTPNMHCNVNNSMLHYKCHFLESCNIQNGHFQSYYEQCVTCNISNTLFSSIPIEEKINHQIYSKNDETSSEKFDGGICHLEIVLQSYTLHNSLKIKRLNVTSKC